MQLDFAVDGFRVSHWLAPLELEGRPSYAAGTFQETAPSSRLHWTKVYSLEAFLHALDDAFMGRRQIRGVASIHLTACAGVKELIQEQVTLRFDLDMRPRKLTVIIEEGTSPDRRQALWNRLARDIATIPGVKPFV